MGIFSSRSAAKQRSDGWSEAAAPLQEPGLLGGAVERAPMAMAQPPRHEGVDWAGVIADGLAGLAGRPGPYAAMQAQNRQQQQEEAVWNRRRQQAQDDWRAQYDYTTNHPRDDDFTQQMRAAGIDPGSPQAMQMRQQKLQNSVDPARMMEINGRPTLVGGRWGYPGQSTGAYPAQPVGKLTPMGGPGATPGTFR